MQDLRGRSLEDIAAERAQLVQQSHAGALAASATQEPTFTLSNVGPGHIDAFSAIISPPQVAILSVGSIQQRPHVVDSQLVIRPTATLTLGVDHRAIDGRQAAAFLEQLKATLES
jgi:pyruvate dehydrogenase E2 component (dihydrolipoamide acetyltransferase)